jgi:hypothetical protein
MRLSPVLVLAATLAFAPVHATDLTITFNTTVKGTASTEVHYFSSAFNFVRNEKAQRDTLVDFRQGVTYLIDHKKKLVQKISFDDAMAAMEGMQKKMPEGLSAMMGAIMGDPNDVKVSQQGTETVAGRTCQVWLVHVGKLDTTLSVDPTLKIAKAGPAGATWKRYFEEVSKIKGIHLKTRMTGFMGMDTLTEATRIEAGPIPASTFALPAGYATEDLGRKIRDQAK